MKVSLFNVWHDDNKGDSAIAMGTIALVRALWPDAEVTVFGLTEDADQRTRAMRHLIAKFPDVDVRPSPLPTELRGRSSVRPLLDVPVWLGRLAPVVVRGMFGHFPVRLADAVRDADVVVCVGGSNMYTDPSVSAIVSYARLLTVVAPLFAGARAGKRTVILGHTLGPFPRRRKLAAMLARRALGSADAVVVRDRESVALSAELGQPEAVLAPDLAFNLPLTQEGSSRFDSTQAYGDLVRPVIVVIRQHPSLPRRDVERLFSEIAGAVEDLCARDLVDGALVVAHTMGPTPIEDDRAVSREIAGVLASRGLVVQYIDADLDPAQLVELYRGGAAMIAVRLHAAILALMSGTPTFAISYFSSKARGVMREFGLEGSVSDFESVTARIIADDLGSRIASTDERARVTKIALNQRAELRSGAVTWLVPEEATT